MKQIQRLLLKIAGIILPAPIGGFISRLLAGKFIQQFKAKATDSFVELLLHCMDLYICLSRSFRKNLNGYKGNILLETRDDEIGAGVRIQNNDMKVIHHSFEDWDARIRFKNAKALRSFLFSKDQDILSAILKNDVEVDGNLNHIYKFSFLAREMLYNLKLI